MNNKERDELIELLEQRNQILEKLKEEYPIVDQVSFNQFNISDKLQENMNLKMQYDELYDHHCYILEKIMEKYDEIKCKRYDHYKFNHDRVLSKTEIEEYYLKSDPQLKKYNKVIEKQKLKVNFFKLCKDSIDKLYWRMKQFIDNERVN